MSRVLLLAVVLTVVLSSALAQAAPKPCRHPYFPAKKVGDAWTWRVGKGLHRTETISKLEPKRATWDVRMLQEGKEPTGVVAQQVITCAAGGVRVEEKPLDIEGVSFEVLALSGANFLDAPKLVKGAKWADSITVRMKAEKIVATSVSVTENVVVGPEQVTVEAGTYDALKIEKRVTTKTTYDVAPPSGAVHVGRVWIVKGVGIAKLEVVDEASGEKSAMELVSHPK